MSRENSIENVWNQLLTFAKKHWVPCMSSGTEERLLQYLMTYKPKSVLEVGSAIGYCTSFFAYHSNTWWWRVTSFEISHPSYMLAIHTLHMIHAYNARIYHANILHIPLEKIVNEKYDFVFIDGAKSEYVAYIERILPFCKPWCTFICDDMLMYKDKVALVYPLLEKYWYTYKTIKLDADDGIVVFTTH